METRACGKCKGFILDSRSLSVVSVQTPASWCHCSAPFYAYVIWIDSRYSIEDTSPKTEVKASPSGVQRIR